MAWNKNAEVILATFFTLLLVACGGDSGNSTEVADDNGREVATLFDMGRCTSEREGDTVYVAEKLRDYICINHAWVDASQPLNLTSSSTESYDLKNPIPNAESSSSEQNHFVESSSSLQGHLTVNDVYGLGSCDASRSGYAMLVNVNGVTYLCDGMAWSVYVIPNLTPISSSSVDMSIVPAYSEVETIMQLGKCESENARTLVMSDTTYYVCKNGNWIKDGEHGFAIQKRSVLGVAQKGPFKFGSPVYLRELVGDSLLFSGKVYTDEISSNKGDFVIPNVSLIYPYAAIEVRGQYRNEVTGNYSDAEISLFALTDLEMNGGSKVNVNLLTHLEYARAMFLVRNGYSVYAAKRQADHEIMTAFQLPTTITYSEILSVFEDSEDHNVNYANASLMMLSLLFLGNRSDAEITTTIENFVKDIETDGEWNDSTTMAQMADFATTVDGDEIRANVKAWNILDIPAFEEQLEMFWNNVYGLGGCTSVRNGVVAQNNNHYSENFGTYYMCVSSYSSSHWVKATTVEKDTYGWGTGENGQLKKGNVTDTIYVYDSGWVVAPIETSIGICSSARVGVVDKFADVWYICRDGEWQVATILEYDTYGLTGVEGDAKPGVVNSSIYYVLENGAWRQAKNEMEIALGICTTMREGVVDDMAGTYCICKSGEWETATALDYDTYGLIGVEGEVKEGLVTGSKYVYRDGKWNAASAVESNLGSCFSTNAGIVSKYSSTYYICKSNEWQKASTLEYDTYGWAVGQNGEVKKGSVTSSKYVYRDGKWNAASAVESNLGSCFSTNAGIVSKYSSTYYICKSNEWETATTLEYDTYGLICSNDGTIVTGNIKTSNKYVCDNGIFRAASANEITLNLGCTSYTRNDTIIHITNGERIVWECSTNWVEKGPIMLVDERNNMKYKTVKIGNQIWMAENLNYDYNEGTAKSYCYNNLRDSCAKYGRLYTWSAAMDSAAKFSTSGSGCGLGVSCSPNGIVRGVCPEGWHLPSYSEFDTLMTAVGGSNKAGTALKSTSGWFEDGNGADANNFSALPAGYVINKTVLFKDARIKASFWSASEFRHGSASAYNLVLNYNYEYAYLDYSESKIYAFSVRCVQDSN